MAWTAADLAAIEAAIATGATRVRYADREVTYRDLAEMKETRRMIAASLSTATPLRQVRVKTSKGFHC